MSRTTTSTTTSRVASSPGERAFAGTAAALFETIKPGITRLVTITTTVGFAMAGLGRSWSTSEFVTALLGCVIGTFLSAGGANALNEWMERDRDKLMDRTKSRPLPKSTLESSTVLAWGLGLCFGGTLILLLICGPMPALISLACVVSYLAIYTPLKTVSPLSTLAGAIPGALPPLIGWAAATEAEGLQAVTEAGGLSLFGLMFVWQLPHFFAIAWLYRDDYAKGGYRMLPIIDPTGRVSALTILVTAVLLLPLTLFPAWAMPKLLGLAYIAIAALTGLAYIALAIKLVGSRSRHDARLVFFASIIHLPVLLLAMVGEALVRTLLGH
ncbi:MAG: heme o synthase [Planctomycetota bacterium]